MIEGMSVGFRVGPMLGDPVCNGFVKFKICAKDGAELGGAIGLTDGITDGNA